MSSNLAADPGVAAAIDLLSAWIESQMAYLGLPGLSIGIVHDQILVWARGFGHADVDRREPATPDTLYRIASVTKLFTSTAILKLRDAGKLRLDDPLGGHLPWFCIGRSEKDAAPITIRHLLTHTAGLPREAGSPYWSDGKFPSPEEIRERLPELQTVLPVGTEWKYSNLGLTLAGEVVAAASGRAYAEYITEEILAPLGMRGTSVLTPAPGQPGLATGYTRRLPSAPRQPAPFTDGRGITAAANMTTCVSDLARFAMLQFRDGPAGGAQVLHGSTLREMHRVHWIEPDWAAGWGLGFRITREKGATYVGHSGRLRGFRTLFHLCPADKIGVIVMINADDGNPPVFAEKAFDWVAPAIRRVVNPPEAAGPAPGWQRYAGKYRSPWADAQVLVVDGALAMIDPSQPDPLAAVGRLRPVADHTFRLETKDGYAANAELVVFELDADGHVTRVKVGDNFLMPVTEW
jgi:CubicO group peptidase (beta-lactamase class C family)